MSESGKPLKSPLLRCPVCFGRDLDVNLLHHPVQGHLYCVKCGFTGEASRVQEMYRQQRQKYLHIDQKLTLEALRKL